MCEVWEVSAWFGRGNWGWKVEGQKVGEVREPVMYVWVGEVACGEVVGDGEEEEVWDDDVEDEDEDDEGKGGNEATAALSASSPRAINVHLYPFEAKRCAVERPMPRLPPVMRMCGGRGGIVWIFLPRLALLHGFWWLCFGCVVLVCCYVLGGVCM
jgi:hypothetical protein